MKSDPKPEKPQLQFEKSLRERGFKQICGLDEAGRGAWAGPLVCAAVILKSKGIFGLDDSKRLSPSEREKLFEKVRQNSIAFSWAICEVEQINAHGIQTATYLAFLQAIQELKKSPDHLLVDHYKLPGTSIPQISITFGDQISQSIAAASIVAKVIRDRKMSQYNRLKKYSQYNFGQNFGYGTKEHKRIIFKVGLSDQHRLKFCRKIVTLNQQTNLFGPI